MNWNVVKEGIKNEVEDILAKGTPSIRNIDEVIGNFRKVIFYITQDRDLNGLSQVLPTALQEAFDEKVGQVGPLKILVESLEAYLKKLYVIGGIGPTSKAKDKGFTLIPVLKDLHINAALSAQSKINPYPQLDEASLSGYSGATEYLEHICVAYVTRNKVHVAPKWSKAEVLQKLSSVMVIYLYATYHFSADIQALPDAHPEINVASKINSNDKYLYYFISYGDTSNKIKNQIVNAYILQYLQKQGKVSIENLRADCNTFFHATMDLNYYMSLIIPLRDAGSVKYFKEDRAIELTPQEIIKIQSLQASFDEDKDLFFLYFDDVCKEFNLTMHSSSIYDRLRSFFESNYQIDIAEGLRKGETVPFDENERYKDFLDYLTSLTNSAITSKSLFAKLIGLSKTSDFLLKICASSVFANISNPERFEQYVRQHERIVYLDTQVILFALCLDYGDDIEYNNFFYRTVDELFALFYRDARFEVHAAIGYLKEAAHQLRLALMLIPFEEMGGETLSSNVFYQFYYYLKNNGKLHADDKSYADFMYNFLQFREADAYKHNYQQIAVGNIADMLSGFDFNLQTFELPAYTVEASAVIHDVLDDEGGKIKSKHIIGNDAKMLTYLCASNEHTTEPFFLTWDKHWEKYRKGYMETYVRSQPISFHLFNPAKFINHCSLINFKINPKAMTDDLLSLVESYHSYVNTQTIWDQVNKFTTIEYITAEQRRRRITSMVSIFKNEMQFTSEDLETKQRRDKMVVEFEDVTTVINDHYYNHSQYNLNDYWAALRDDKYFDKIVRIVVDAAKGRVDSTFLGLIDALIADFKEEQEHQR